MMARTISGHSGAISIAGGAVNGKVLGWKLTITEKNVETTAAGDAWAERVHLNNDWKAEIQWEAPLSDVSWDMHQGLVGTEVVIALKRKSGDSNPYFTDTGLVTEVSVDAPADNAIKGTATIECCTGVAPSTGFDTTPA